MPLTSEQQEKIAIQVIRTLYNQFDRFFENEPINHNVPFHDAFLGVFSNKLQDKVHSIPTFISLSSWLHGLNTSLGQSFFENVAKILCEGEKKEFTTTRNTNLPIEKTQKETISTIITNLSNDSRKPSLIEENNNIFQKPSSSNLIEGTDFTVDVFFENDTEVVCIELKTVNPNKSVFRAEKEKILEAKACLNLKHPSKTIKYYLGFPFDPLNDTPCGYDKQRFMNHSVGFTKYFDGDEILLAGELWDYLSETNHTMENILEIINTIATPEFMENITFLNDHTNRTQPSYITLLEKWFLYREKTLIEKTAEIKPKLTTRKLQSLYHKSCLPKGEYNEDHITSLLKLLP